MGMRCYLICISLLTSDIEAEASIILPLVVKSQIIGKDPDAGKD